MRPTPPRGPAIPWTMAGTALARARDAHPSLGKLQSRWAGPPPIAAGAASLAQSAPELWQLAWELARLVPAARSPDVPGDAANAALVGDTHADARAALHRLAFALLVLSHQGSSVVPLDDEGTKALRGVLAATELSSTVSALLDEILQGRDIPAPLAPFIGTRGAAPVLRAQGTLGLHRLHRMEERLAASLAQLIAQPPVAVDSQAWVSAWQDVRTSTARAWTNEQQVALLNAVHLPFSVVSGGPGTGKTSIVVGLLRLLVRLGVKPGAIALVAPTGKAANRMFEVVREELSTQPAPEDQGLRMHLPAPRTLHRFLGYAASTDRFRHDEGNPVSDDVVVVDESSMVDLSLMDQLLRACRPREAGRTPRRVVLLGDSHQLPSVEAGMVLHHLTENDAPGGPRVPPVLGRPWHGAVTSGPTDPIVTFVPQCSDLRARFVTTLTKSHRMDPNNPAGRAIAVCARAIRAKDVARLVPPHEDAPRTVASAHELAFTGVEHLEADMQKRPPEAFFEVWWRQRLTPDPAQTGGFGLDALHGEPYRFLHGTLHPDDAPRLAVLLRMAEAQRILCLNRGEQPSGAQRANAWFAARRAAERRRAPEPGASLRHRASRGLFAGEPVLFLNNDYHLGLFNGDHGVLAWTRLDGDAPRLRAIFPRAAGPAAFGLDAVLHNLARAYALTVHKAQGSQVEHAAVLLPSEEDNPLLVNQLLYTAVSRASRSVVLVGPIERLALGAQRTAPRFCRVMDKVEALVSPG